MSRRPIGRPSDPGAGNLYDAIQDLGKETTPEFAPKLRAHAIGTLAELRRTRGDIAGNAGPASCMLSGFTAPMDGGQGVFLWDPTSVAKDDGGVLLPGGTVQVANIATGRWRRTSPPVPQVLTGTVLRSTWLTGTSLASAAGCKRARVWIRAGGGGGGAAFSAVDCGGGGAAGGWAYFETTHIPTSWTYAIGAGGAGGIGSVPTLGFTGGNSTFSDGVTTVTAFGGPGGDLTGIPAAPPTISTNGTKNGSGSPGAYGNPSTPSGGNGGSSDLGGGGIGSTGGANGGAAVGPGSGGGGASRAGGAQTNGGAGTAGDIFLEELS